MYEIFEFRSWTFGLLAQKLTDRDVMEPEVLCKQSTLGSFPCPRASYSTVSTKANDKGARKTGPRTKIIRIFEYGFRCSLVRRASFACSIKSKYCLTSGEEILLTSAPESHPGSSLPRDRSSYSSACSIHSNASSSRAR